MLSFAYVGNKGSNILGAMELNPAVYGPGATTGNTNARRIYAGMSAMEIASPFQRSRYDSFQFTGTKRSSKGLTVLGTYVYSVNKDNSSSTIEGGASYPRSSSDPDIDYSYSDFDVRHRMNLSVVYDLPWKKEGAAGAFVNDWQLNVIFVARTGLPFSVLSGTDRSLSAIGRDNADLVGDITPPSGSDVLVWFNPAAFTPARPGHVRQHRPQRLPRAGRGDLRLGARQELPDRAEGETAVPDRGVQPDEPDQLQQPELDVHGRGQLRQDHRRRRPARVPARPEVHVLCGLERPGGGVTPPPPSSAGLRESSQPWLTPTPTPPVCARASCSRPPTPGSRSSSASCPRTRTSSS